MIRLRSRQEIGGQMLNKYIKLSGVLRHSQRHLWAFRPSSKTQLPHLGVKKSEEWGTSVASDYGPKTIGLLCIYFLRILHCKPFRLLQNESGFWLTIFPWHRWLQPTGQGHTIEGCILQWLCFEPYCYWVPAVCSWGDFGQSYCLTWICHALPPKT